MVEEFKHWKIKKLLTVDLKSLHITYLYTYIYVMFNWKLFFLGTNVTH